LERERERESTKAIISSSSLLSNIFPLFLMPIFGEFHFIHFPHKKY
jgi:hypothetical protein